MRDYLAGHWTLVLLWALVLSAVDFCLMGADKRRARRDAWRVPEKTLWLFALLGSSRRLAGDAGLSPQDPPLVFPVRLPLLAALDAALLLWLRLG